MGNINNSGIIRRGKKKKIVGRMWRRKRKRGKIGRGKGRRRKEVRDDDDGGDDGDADPL